jgi:hypothetical protein
MNTHLRHKQRTQATAKGQDMNEEEARLRKRILHTNPSITKAHIQKRSLSSAFTKKMY